MYLPFEVELFTHKAEGPHFPRECYYIELVLAQKLDTFHDLNCLKMYFLLAAFSAFTLVMTASFIPHVERKEKLHTCYAFNVTPPDYQIMLTNRAIIGLFCPASLSRVDCMVPNKQHWIWPMYESFNSWQWVWMSYNPWNLAKWFSLDPCIWRAAYWCLGVTTSCLIMLHLLLVYHPLVYHHNSLIVGQTKLHLKLSNKWLCNEDYVPRVKKNIVTVAWKLGLYFITFVCEIFVSFIHLQIFFHRFWILASLLMNTPVLDGGESYFICIFMTFS